MGVRLDALNPETCTSERWAFARDGRLLSGYGGVCHVQWPRDPTAPWSASARVRRARVVGGPGGKGRKQLTDDRDRAKMVRGEAPHL